MFVEMAQWMLKMGASNPRYYRKMQVRWRYKCFADGRILDDGVKNVWPRMSQRNYEGLSAAPCGKTGMRLWKVTRVGSKGTLGGGVLRHSRTQLGDWNGKNCLDGDSDSGSFPRGFERSDDLRRRTGPDAGIAFEKADSSAPSAGSRDRSAVSQRSNRGGNSIAEIHGRRSNTGARPYTSRGDSIREGKRRRLFMERVVRVDPRLTAAPQGIGDFDFRDKTRGSFSVIGDSSRGGLKSILDGKISETTVGGTWH